LLTQRRQAAAVVIDHLHAKAQGTAPGDGLTDAAHAEHTQCRAVHILPAELVHRPAVPLTAAQPALRFAEATGRGHHQRETEVGGGFGQHVRRVADQHAPGGAGRQVDVVVAHRHRTHRPQLRAGVQQRGVDALACGDEDSIAALQPLDQGRVAPGLVGRIGHHIEDNAQPVEDLLKHGSGDQHTGLGRHRWFLWNRQA